jgi:hypothetical protein
MDASNVAGLLVLLGVVGVLAAIIGSGLEAGPVKFPSIPGTRQVPLAVASVVVIAGGLVWWAILQRSSSDTPNAAASDVPRGTLRIVLVPAKANIRVGDPLSVSSTIYDVDGQIGTEQCAMTWRDAVGGKIVRRDTTACEATFTEPAVTQAGLHRVSVNAEGSRGAIGSGSKTVEISVTR